MAMRVSTAGFLIGAALVAGGACSPEREVLIGQPGDDNSGCPADDRCPCEEDLDCPDQHVCLGDECEPCWVELEVCLEECGALRILSPDRDETGCFRCECPRCIDDRDCEFGALCDEGVCHGCERDELESDCPDECEGEQLLVEIERNGCPVCECAPESDCFDDEDCEEPGEVCYPGLTCADGCREPDCCWGNLCAVPGCLLPSLFTHNCDTIGCQDGACVAQIDDGCPRERKHCECVLRDEDGGDWSCFGTDCPTACE